MQPHAAEGQFLASDGRHRVLVGLKYMLTEASPGMESEVFFLGSSAMVVEGITDAIVLEALACREAQALALDLMENRIVVASDSKMMVSDIEKGTEGRHSSIVKEIAMRAMEFGICDFVFEGRALN